LESPLFDVAEDPTGITFGSNARFTVSVGTGPGQCVPPPGAPNLTASYSPASSFPTFGATTPVPGAWKMRATYCIPSDAVPVP
jgi:hypothetical protein